MEKDSITSSQTSHKDSQIESEKSRLSTSVTKHQYLIGNHIETDEKGGFMQLMNT
jgi:hypothetical protein